MTTTAGRAERSSDDLPSGRPLGYALPRDMTPVGLQAFTDEVQEFATQLGQQLKLDAQTAHRTDPQYTADDVRAARRHLNRSTSGYNSGKRVFAAILLTIATLGISPMANFLHSPWQVAVFLLLVCIGVIGLVLTWVCRPAKTDS